MSGENEKSKGTGDWRLKQIALVAYAVATAIGMFYGNAYYDHFGIVLLDYASPIDLLFIALANLEAVVAALSAPVLFLGLCLIMLLAPLLVYVLLVLGVVLSWAVLLLCAGIVVGVQAFAVAIVRVTALRTYWLRVAVAAVWADRRTGAEAVRAVADQGDVSEASERPLPLATAYQRASQHNPVWKIIDPRAYVHFINNKIFATFDPVGEWGKKRLLDLKDLHQASFGILDAYCSSEAKEGSSGRRWRFRSWEAIDLRPRLLLVALVLVFLAYLLYAASQSGTIDAQKLLSDAKGQLKDAEKQLDDAEKQPDDAKENLDDAQDAGDDSKWLVDLWEAIQKPLLRDMGDLKAPPLPGVFVVPTENLASLDFSNCFGEINGERRLFGRANFRQDAGDDSRDGTPECLLRVGGLGRWQFLADIQNGGARKQRRMAHVHSGDPRDPVIFVVNNGQQSIPLQPEPPPPTAGTEEKVGHPFVVVFDGRTGAVSTPACELQLTAVVGPFPTGQAELESNGPASSEPRAEPPECKIRGEDWTLERVGDDEQGELPEWQDKLIQGTSKMVVLVGRADVRPINNSDFISNMNLATRRTNWVREELEEEKPSLNISNITGGPADSEPNDDPCSRVVEVYTCSADQAATKDA